jgi:mannose/fructose/N-acetylgalactosamine-specific phosphotransferase system component IID
MEAVKLSISSHNVVSVWGTLKHGVSQGSILGPVLLIMYINDLPLNVNSVLETILFADDTSVIISSRNFEDLCSVSSLVPSCMIKWLTANNLVINLGKTNIMKFISKISAHFTLHLGYKEKYIQQTWNTTLLALQTDNHINWKRYIEQMIPKLSSACYALRLMVHISNINILKSIHIASFHSILKYGIILWGNFSNSGNII